MYPNPSYVDGYFGTERETTVIPVPGFPFKEYPTPDLYSRTYDRKYLAEPQNFLPKIARRTAWTNLVIQNEVLTAAAGWTVTALTPTAAFSTAPTGLTVMNKLLETTANSAHSVGRAATVTAAAHEACVFVEGGLGRNWAQLVFVDSAAATFSAFFNIASGYVGTKSAGVTAFVTPLGNSQFLVFMRFTPAAGAGTISLKVSTDGSTVSYTGDAAKGIYATGIQVAAGSSVPYIPTTSATRSILAPDRDAKDPMAYLVIEENPQVQNSKAFQIDRQFARVPLQQVRSSTMPITKPVATNQATGDITVYKQSANNIVATPIGSGSSYYNGYIFAVDNTVYGLLKAGTTATITAVASGQFRVKYKSSTTGNLNYNAADATIAAAINALADVISDGIVVTASNQFLTGQAQLLIALTTGSTSSFFIVDANSFNAASNSLFTDFVNATQQVIQVGYRSTINSHGFSPTADLLCAANPTAGGNMAVLKPQNVALTQGSWAVVDANTIAFSLTAAASLAFFNSFGTYLRAYTPGPDEVEIQIVEDFYLPGVTHGITTAADIPVADPLINDAAFLAAVLANPTGYLNYNADPRSNWKGPIYVQAQRKINMANV
jgi:hypothetical protein